MLCDRMGVNWRELQETPAYVVDDYLMVIEAEQAKAAADAAKAKMAKR